ncbi:MAG: hypothetical protein ABIK89_21080 [Planctomycetota bacterium]
MFIWAIPILGFVGTVIGISASVGAFSGALESAQEISGLKDSLNDVTGGLATAFDTTLIALVMSMLVMFPSSSLQKAEEDLLNWVDEYCNENLLKRLQDGGDLSSVQDTTKIRKAFDAALAPHHAELKAWTEKLESIGSSLTKQIAEELASLKSQLAETPEMEGLPAKVITLPNPRSAPEGTQPQTVLCREGRVLFVDAENIQELAQKKVVGIIQRKKLGRDPAAGIDSKILAEEFNRDPPKNRNWPFDVKMTIAGRVPKLVLERREGGGETADEIKRSSSRYQRQLSRTNRNQYYLQFLVWPDSFEAYLEARRLSSERDLLAGWKAQTATTEHTIDLGGNLRVGPPPPPPKPKPKPKPGEAPPPPPKPAAPPRPRPTDVID